MRDVRELVEIVAAIATIRGAPRCSSAYDRRRRPDILARTGAVNLLNMSLLSDMLPAQLARSAGLGLLGAFAPLRALLHARGSAAGQRLRRDVFADYGNRSGGSMPL